MAAFVMSLAEAGKKAATIQEQNQLEGEAEEKAIFFAPDHRSYPCVPPRTGWNCCCNTGAPLLLSFPEGQRLSRRRLSAFSLNETVQLRLGAPYTADWLRASFGTIARLNGADDAKVMNQTRHKTTDILRRYTCFDNIRQHNAAQELGL
jgi:hypothetical protein